MWEQVRDKLRRLEKLDKTRQVFGASDGVYAFGPKVSPEGIEAWETEVGVAMPDELAAFYRECGNGGIGPHYGMKSLSRLKLYRPAEPYPGAEALRDLAKKRAAVLDENDDDIDDDDYYFYDSDKNWCVPDNTLTGLASVIEYGCGFDFCVVTSGERPGALVFKSIDNLCQDLQGTTLRDEYHYWLDDELERFATIEKLLDTCRSSPELADAFKQECGRSRGLDYMVSYLGANKPPDLFGRGDYYTKRPQQDAWYEEQFAKYKGRRTSASNLLGRLNRLFIGR